MGHLHGRPPGHRVPVERQQPRRPERLHHVLERNRVDLHGAQLAPQHAATGVLGPLLPQGHQAQEQLSCRRPPKLVQPRVQGLGPAGERAGDATDLLVALQREEAVGPPVEHLGQRVLQEGERARLVGDLRHHVSHQPGLELNAHPFGRTGHGPFHLPDRQRGDGERPLGQDVAELAVAQGPVVEVGPERDHHAHAAAGAGERGHQGRDERRPDRVVLHQREDLFELVHQQQQLRVVGGKDPAGGPDQPELVALQHVQQIRAGAGSHAQQRRLQLLEGMGAGRHLDHEPTLRSGDRSGPKRGDEPGPNDRGLAAAGRPHHGQEPSGVGPAHPGHQIGGHALPAEEVERVGFAE